MSELERRKVVQTTLVYLLAAWGLSAGAADIFGALGLPEKAAGYAVIIIFGLTPIVAVLSWLYEVNKEGIQRDQGPPADELSTTETIIAPLHRLSLTLTYQDQSKTFYRDVTVGRGKSCLFQVRDPHVSRQHVRFEFVDGRWFASDLGSANGTKIDGRELDREGIEGESVFVLYPEGPPLQVKVAGDTETATTLYS